MFDRGLNLTLRAVRRQIAAMPHDLYLIRLIHNRTRRAFPGERLWTATQLTHLATLRFLRVRNREGCDVYIQPYAENRNPGYILVDLDERGLEVIQTMRADGLAPCAVLQTSPGHLQVWLHVSTTPLQPALASAIGKQLAQRYGGDLASTDWRHLGRLAGFTNQKPQRRNWCGHAPLGQGGARSRRVGRARQRIVPGCQRRWARSSEAGGASRAPAHHQYRLGSHRHLCRLAAPAAHSRTVSAAGLEHCR